ncbi:MAG: hypothetical protein O2899_03625 [Bacteroidetes bacterium]|nr:hypothetical protein [Bacteroidota bacterium]
MAVFDTDHFVLRLIAETLFYDEEYEALGNLSLIDPEEKCERYVASFAPEDGLFVLEEATEWEDYEPGEADDIGYALAVDSREVETFETAEDAAAALLRLAREHGLAPSITLLFEEEEGV